MPRIYIDANIFLGFYRSADEPLELLATLQQVAHSLVFPQQVIREFRRNRLAVIRTALHNFEQSIKLHSCRTALFQKEEDYRALQEKLQEARVLVDRIKKNLEQLIDGADDPTAAKVESLFSSPEAQTIPTTDSIVTAAQRRKLIGEPPYSDDRTSIGDEIVWESLLAACDEDLVIVTKDKGFVEFEHILKMEFSGHKRKFLGITDKISSALALIRVAPPPRLLKEESRVEAKEAGLTIISVQDSSGNPVAKCDLAMVADNGTYLKQETGGDGFAHFGLLPDRQYTLLCAHPDFPARKLDTVPESDMIVIPLFLERGVGSLITQRQWIRLPGLSGEFNLIHDSHDRLYLYTRNIGVNDGRLQPIKFDVGQEMKFEDVQGNTRMVKCVAVKFDCFLLEYREA